MKIYFVAFCSCIALSACSEKKGLPDGIALSIPSGGDPVLTLEDKKGVAIRQQGGTNTLLIANLNAGLQVVQTLPGGKTPRSMDVFSEEKARFTVLQHTGEDTLLIIDEDGDGLPDVKVEGKKRFRVKEIIWTEDTPKKE